MRTRLVAGLVLLVALVIASSEAGADTRRPGRGGAYVDRGGDPTAIADDSNVESQIGKRRSKNASDDPCEWRVRIEDDFKFSVYDVDSPQRQHSATGRWLERWCPGVGGVEVNGYFLVPEGGLADPRQVAATALASVQIDPPVIHTNPSEADRLFVQVPTWLWVQGDWWKSHEATARAGRVWSTVKATPVSVTWSMGDGSTVTCNGPGSEWSPAVRADVSDCTYTYRSSSVSRPTGRFEMTATVTFKVSWTSNASGGGTLPSVTRVSSRSVAVGEIQAVGTRGGN